MAGGPAVRGRGRGSGGVGERGGGAHEGRDSAFEPARWEAGEGGTGPSPEPLSDAIFVLRREHLRGRAERAAGAAGVGGHDGEAEEGEGDLAEHAQLLDGRLGRQGRVSVFVMLGGTELIDYS